MNQRTLLAAGFSIGGILLAPHRAGAAPGGPGTAAGYTTIMSYRLQSANPTNPAVGYTLLHQGSAGTSCFGQPQAECLGYAQIDAPEGARLELLEVWGFDESPDADLHFAVIANCEPPAGIATSTILKEGTFVQSGGDFFAAESLDDVTVNNADCGYTIRLRFTDPERTRSGSRSGSARWRCAGIARSVRRRRQRPSATCLRVTRSSSSSRRCRDPASQPAATRRRRSTVPTSR